MELKFFFYKFSLQENTIVTVYNDSPSGFRLIHAALLYKMDPQTYYIKNTNSKEPIIEIPRSRVTDNHRFISQKGASDFKTTTEKIRARFNAHAKHTIDWNLQKGQWYLDDDGYCLKFNKK